MSRWPRVLAPFVLMLSAVTVAGLGSATEAGAQANIVIPSGGSEVHAVIQVETSPSYAGDPVHIDSSQLEASCGGLIVFETLQGGSTLAPERNANSIIVILDDDGNATVVVDGAPCAPGTSVIEADLTVAPFITALTTLVVDPPAVTPVGLFASPSSEVETGDTTASGDSDIYTVFTVETNPVYAEQPVEISSPQLEDRCITGWRIEPGSGLLPAVQGGSSTVQGILDDDGNATFVFKGSSCAAGPSAVIADVEAGSHPTYVTTFTVVAPQPTLAAIRMGATDTVKKGKGHKHPKKHHHGGSGAGSGSGSSPAPMTVDASPNPVVLTGVPSQGQTAPL